MPGETGLGNVPISFHEGEIEEFGDGVYMLHSWSNVCIIETAEGVVLFDAGFEFYGRTMVDKIRSITDKPVLYIIYGHGHADHAFGVKPVINDALERGHPRPTIVAQKNLSRRFDRYREMLPYHDHINRIQFGLPEDVPVFPRTYTYPDETYQDSFSFQLGGITFELTHAKGETDDATWMWVPERKTACVSDLWVWSCPNAGNPFKVQRYVLEWAQALESIAAKSPECMLPGHGNALEGAEHVGDACLTVARALRYLRDQVIDMLNQGKWQEEILNSFDWPVEFADSQYLAPIYGHPYFVVQAILRRYHGWFDGNATHLFPSSSSDVGREVVGLAGAPSRVLERARALAEEGRAQLALHMVDFLIDSGAEPREKALELKAELLESLGDREKSLIARNIFHGGARRIRDALGENQDD